jgi:hypothetical protein
MTKQSLRLAALTTILSLSLAAPRLALADSHGDQGEHDPDHGPMPIAILGSVFGGALWLVSTPFCLLFAPKHIGDSFDTLVMVPWRKTIGSDAP